MVILFFTAPLTVGAIGGVFLLAVVLYNKAYFEKIPAAVKVAKYYLRDISIIGMLVFITLTGIINIYHVSLKY